MEYVDLLRVGERTRDASDKVAGFLYQDLIALEIILDSENNEAVYMEWTEDVFVENEDNIKIYQVKYYPKSDVKYAEIYKELFYQFLRIKLYMKDSDEKKEITNYCINYSHSKLDIKKCKNKIEIKKENDLNKLDVKKVLEEFSKKGSMEERIKFIVEEVGSTELMNQFQQTFVEQKKPNICEMSNLLKTKLYILMEQKVKENNITETSIQEILLAIAIQYVQSSYVVYSSKDDLASKRRIDKNKLLEKMTEVCLIDEESIIKRLKYRVLAYIDELYRDIVTDIENVDVINIYGELYKSTKEYFTVVLNDKHKRFIFLNTLSTEDYTNLNWKQYSKLSAEGEKNILFEHKQHIIQFVCCVWKILFGINCNNFSEFIEETNDACIFNFPKERIDSVLIVAETGRRVSTSATKVLSRVSKMALKPKKWYLNGVKGTYEYNIDINKITELKTNQDFSVSYINDNAFAIECLQCVRIDGKEMEEQDLYLIKGLFEFNCIGG